MTKELLINIKKVTLALVDNVVDNAVDNVVVVNQATVQHKSQLQSSTMKRTFQPLENKLWDCRQLNTIFITYISKNHSTLINKKIHTKHIFEAKYIYIKKTLKSNI